MEGQKAWISSNVLMCVLKIERRSYRFWMTWGWVMNDRIFIFGWTIPLRSNGKMMCMKMQSLWHCLYRVCSPLSCGGFQKLQDGFWSLSVAFKMASHSGSYSRCSEEPGRSAISTIYKIKTLIHTQRLDLLLGSHNMWTLLEELETSLLMETAE